MIRFCWWLVDRVSRLLEPDERAAVRGDLAESGETGGQALRGVLGLVVRRQAALWKHWRPWLALVGVVVPLGTLLSLVSKRTADGSAIYVWLYANNWEWTFLGNAGFRHDLAHFSASVLMSYVALMCWSWTTGFVLGALSRGAIQVNGVLFWLVLLLAEPLGARYLGHSLLISPWRYFENNAAVFALTFYRVMFPLIVQAILVLLPSVWGMRQGSIIKIPRASALLLTLAALAAAADQPTVRAVLQAANQRKAAPEFALKDSSGATVNLKDYRGKVVLLDFWATWCHGCKQEIPWFSEFERKYAAKGLTVVGVSLDDDGWKVVRPFLLTAKPRYRIVLGDRPTAKKYSIETMPDTFLIDRQGRIAAKYVGLVDKDNVETNIRTMLSQP